jgi:hypothetical protein
MCWHVALKAARPLFGSTNMMRTQARGEGYRIFGLSLVAAGRLNANFI